MRNSFLILFPLFVSLGVSSGIIAPTGITEVSISSSRTPNSSYETTSQSNLKNISAINETEIFDTAQEKASNLSERSLIFINKKLKTLRRIPLINRYKGYQAFMSQPAQGSNRWIIEEKIPQKFVKGQRSDSVNTIIRQLFDPNLELKKPQSQAVYRYVYPDQPKRNKSCMYEEQETKMKLKLNETKANPDLIEKVDVKFIAKPLVKIFDVKSLDIYKTKQKLPSKVILSTVAPEEHSKNMVIKSYTNRKPKSNGKDCAFYKPSWLHRMTFINKNLIEKKNQVDVLSNTDNNLGNTYTDEKLDRYIKEALSELQISDNELDYGQQNTRSQEIGNNVIDTTDQKLDELMAEIGVD